VKRRLASITLSAAIALMSYSVAFAATLQITSLSCDTAADTITICTSGGTMTNIYFYHETIYGSESYTLTNVSPGCTTFPTVAGGPVDLMDGDLVQAFGFDANGPVDQMQIWCNVTPTLPPADDGRLSNPGAPAAVYCDPTQIDIYEIADGEGELAIYLTEEEMADLVPGGEPMLIKQEHDIRLFLLPDGSFKLLMLQPDGKTYFLFWKDCIPYNEGAEWNVN
jgi:hypothetical protein